MGIYHARIKPSVTNNVYILGDEIRCGGDERYEKNVGSYVFNLVDVEGCRYINSEYSGKIIGLPSNSIVLANAGVPLDAYWYCED